MEADDIDRSIWGASRERHLVATCTGGSAGTVIVNYNTVDGSALDVQDYIAASGTITSGSNEVVKTIAIALVDNNLQEPDEVFSVVLSNPIGAALDDQSTAQ